MFESDYLKPLRNFIDAVTMGLSLSVAVITYAAESPAAAIEESSFCKSLVPGQYILPAKEGWWNWGMAPAANALRAPGQWQSYDIIYRRPIVRDGVVLDQGSMTVLVNGVVVQDSTPLDGGGGHKERKALNHAYPDAGPLLLQDHGNPVHFRNIWCRPLRPRPAEK